MQQAQKDLLILLAKALFNKTAEVAPDDTILKEAEVQAVKMLVANDYRIFANNMRCIDAHARLTNDLEKIPFVTIKGYASAHYYPLPEKRTMGDVDLYVDPDDYDSAVSCLIEKGYIPTDYEHVRHEAFRKGSVLFELHSEIKGIPNGKDGVKVSNRSAEDKVRAMLSDLIETSERVKTPYGTICIPNAFHHGLIMLLHVAGHMINDGGIGLRHLCDWAVYVNKTDVIKYKEKLESIGLWTFARQLTAVSVRYLGLPEQGWEGDWDDGFLEALINDILEAGNFSKKAPERGAENALSNEESVVKSAIAMTKKRFPFCEKHPVLLPVGIICYGTSYLSKRISGKRRWITSSGISEGKQRKDLYSKFELFKG